MAEASGETPNAAKARDDVAVRCHTHGVRVLRNFVNVESVRVPCDEPYVSDEQTTGAILRGLMRRAGYSMREFAKAAGYKNASGVQRYLEDDFDGSLSVEVTRKFETALVGKGEPPITEAEVWFLSGLVPMGTVEPNGVPFKMEGASMERMREDLPVLGTTLGAERFIDGEAIEQTNLNRGDVVRYIKRPVILNERQDAYGLYVQGSSMYPAFSDGSIIYVESKRPARIGDDVVLYLRTDNPDDDDGQTARAVLVKRLVRKTAAYFELEQFTPAKVFRIAREEVVMEHRVIPWDELLS